MIILGVDPGKTGALAVVQVEKKQGVVLAVLDTPTHAISKGKTEVDAVQIANWIENKRSNFGIDHAYVERVSSRPGQGVVSVFDFGKSYGAVMGVLAAIKMPTTFITPAEWKRNLRVPSDKKASRGRASQLMPSSSTYWPLVKHDGRAEAAMIGLYGANAR